MDREGEAAEIEITPEMIEAGADVVWRAFGDVISYGSETGRAVAARVFLAMAPLSSSAREAEDEPRPLPDWQSYVRDNPDLMESYRSWWIEWGKREASRRLGRGR